MTRITPVLTIALLPLLASAQWATYLSNVLGSRSKVALSKSETLQKTLVPVNSENWVDVARTEKKPGAGHHLFLYFTDREPEVIEVDGEEDASVPDKINAKFQESIYNLTVSKAAPSTSVAWINCRSNSEAASVCPLFVAVHYPQLWHVTANQEAPEDAPPSQRIEMRRIPLANLSGTNVTSLTSVIESGSWKQFKTWNGPFNPLDGALNGSSVVLYELLRIWTLVPNWLVALAISLLGQQIAARFYNSPTAPSTSTKKKVNEFKDKIAEKVEQSAPKDDRATTPPAVGPTTRSRRAKTPAS